MCPMDLVVHVLNPRKSIKLPRCHSVFYQYDGSQPVIRWKIGRMKCGREQFVFKLTFRLQRCSMPCLSGLPADYEAERSQYILFLLVE